MLILEKKIPRVTLNSGQMDLLIRHLQASHYRYSGRRRESGHIIKIERVKSAFLSHSRPPRPFSSELGDDQHIITSTLPLHQTTKFNPPSELDKSAIDGEVGACNGLTSAPSASANPCNSCATSDDPLSE